MSQGALPGGLALRLEELLGAPVGRAREVGGGCINHAAAITCGDQRLFLKWNEDAAPGFFEAEADGLARLRASGVVRAPEPLAWEEAQEGRPAWLVMEWVEGPGASFDRDGFGARLGEALAGLHAATGAQHGLERDNFIGALPQPNAWSRSWVAFFGQRRLGHQRALAETSGRLRRPQLDKLDRLIDRLPELIPDDAAPSPMHGDLWSGNYMIGVGSQPVLVDPAFYLGHREVELAFTELFGGFPRRFYDAYNAHLPLDPGYARRRDLYNAYPLLVHVNLFGGGYVRQLMSVVERYL